MQTYTPKPETLVASVLLRPKAETSNAKIAAVTTHTSKSKSICGKSGQEGQISTNIKPKGEFMDKYKDIDNDSGVAGFETGADFIRVQFDTGAIYLYTYASAGSQNIEQMKKLAAAGDGLNSFINRIVRKLYARKER